MTAFNALDELGRAPASRAKIAKDAGCAKVAAAKVQDSIIERALARG